MFSVFLSSYRNTRENLGEIEKAVETLACGSCSHSISRSPKLPDLCFYNSIETRYMLPQVQASGFKRTCVIRQRSAGEQFNNFHVRTRAHPRRPRGKIIGREEDKTAVSVGAKVYFSCVESHTTKVNFRADRNRRFIFLAPDNLAPGSPRMTRAVRNRVIVYNQCTWK